jgi:hypothetical protein
MLTINPEHLDSVACALGRDIQWECEQRFPLTLMLGHQAKRDASLAWISGIWAEHDVNGAPVKTGSWAAHQAI